MRKGWLAILILLHQFNALGQRIPTSSLSGGPSLDINPSQAARGRQSDKSTPINNSHFQTLDGKAFELARLHKKLIAVVFLSSECPLCQNYSLVLNKLQTRFENDLDVVGVFPGKSEQIASCRMFRKKYNIQFILLTDTLRKLDGLLGARITPEVFLLDHNKNLIYHGAIDNWVVALGTTRIKTTENYLEDGVEEFLNGTPVKIKEKPAIGCLINNF